MRVVLRAGIVCGCIAWAGGATAAPRAPSPPAKGAGAKATRIDPRKEYKLAVQLDASGDYDGALLHIEQGIAVAPQDLRLLQLRGDVLLKIRDYARALSAYEAYLAAHPPNGANKRAAEKIVRDLRAVQSTSLDISLASGPADVYLDSRSFGVFCVAAPTCHKPILPGNYKIIAERPGFSRWTGGVTVAPNATAQLAITLVEKPSLLTVRAAPGARVLVDDQVFGAPATVPAGDHQVVVSLPGHVDAHLTAAAHEGKPVDLDVTLTPLVPIHVAPASATLVLDGSPAAIQDEALALPPGPHVLVARAQGYRELRAEIPADRDPAYKVVVELVPLPPPPPVVALTAPPGRFTTRRRIALAAGGASVAAAAGGTVLGLSAKGLDHDAYALCPSPSTPCARAQEANDLNRRGQSRALQANIAYGVAGAAAFAAALLWLTGAESPVAVTSHLGAGPGLDLTGRF